MKIVLQNYKELLKKVIKDVFSANLDKELDNLDINGNVMNYVGLLSNLDESLCNIAKESLKIIIETLDKSFNITTERKSKYYIKSCHERTIVTVFGEITYKRHFYTSKLTGKNYCYVDRLLGLHKYDYFDPYIKALIIEYSADNSMPKVAKIVNDLIGKRVSIEDKFKYISRQTVRNIILTSRLSDIKIEQVETTPEELYIIADEKWIPTQNNNNENVMEKSLVIFEDIKNHKLINKMIFSSLGKAFLYKALDYLNDRYNLDKIKRIYFMGDGANWIKALRSEFKFHKDLEVIYGLDKFHFKQALHHLCFHEELESILKGYILSDMKEEFNYICECLLKSNPHRQDSILEKQRYILNNWKFINNIYEYKLSCPMEAQISHNIAALFTSRPKGFSLKMIHKLTELRMLYKNNYNVKRLYLHNFNSEKTLTINHEELNFGIFDRNKQVLPIYKDRIFNPIFKYGANSFSYN